MKKDSKIAILLLLLLTGGSAAWAQEDLESDEIIIEKEFGAIIEQSDKIEVTPDAEKPNDEKVNQDYSVPDVEADIPYTPSSVRPLALPKEKRAYRLNSYLKAGFGNLLTPVVEAAYNDQHIANLNFGAYFGHRSSNAKRENQQYSDNNAGAHAHYNFKKVRLGADFDYSRDVHHFYGYADTTFDREDVRQRIRDYKGRFFLGNTKESKQRVLFDQIFDVRFSNDADGAKERSLQSTTDLSKRFGGTHKGGLLVELDFSRWNPDEGSATIIDRTLVSVTPRYAFEDKGWKLEAALQHIFEDSLFHWYPKLRAEHELIPDRLRGYLSWEQDLVKNDFYRFVHENPFIGNGITIANSKTAELAVGLQGGAGRFHYALEGSRNRIKDFPMYVNDPNDTKRFAVVYDPKVIRWNGHAELGVTISKPFNFLVSADFYEYNMSTQAEPWHLPNFRMRVGGTLNLKDKILVSPSIIGISKTKARAADGSIVDLKGTADIGLSAEYRFSPHLSVFADLNNLAGIRHEKWLNYPTFGFNGVFGAKLTY